MDNSHLACRRKNGPAGPILDEEMVRPDQYWPTKYGPAGPILVTKSSLAWPKLVWCHDNA